jgi:hypothetical protein
MPSVHQYDPRSGERPMALAFLVVTITAIPILLANHLSQRDN